MSDLRVFVIAGEISGDNCGGKLIQEMSEMSSNNIVLSGIGGPSMQREGLQSIFPISDISVMGLVEIMPKLFFLMRRINLTTAKILEFKPDIVITIDSPSFCFRVVKKVCHLRRSGTKFVHYVSPSVWAYNRNRVKKMSKCYDLVLALLPFEPHYYSGSKLQCKYVGHYLTEDDGSNVKPDNFRKKHNIPSDKKILGVFSGSREYEVKRLLPIFIDAINNLEQDFIVVYPAVSEDIAKIIKLYNMFAKFEYKIVIPQGKQEKQDMLSSFHCALVKSGTSSLELVIARIPMIVAYKMHWLTAFVARRIFGIIRRIKFVSIANLIVRKEIIPEFLQHNCNEKNLIRGLNKLFEEKFRKKQIAFYEKVLQKLSPRGSLSPSRKAAEEILHLSSSK